MLSALSLTGLFESLDIFSPLLLLVLMPLGFLASAWLTTSMFNYLRPDLDEVTAIDKMGTLLVLISLFGTYCYFVCSILVD